MCSNASRGANLPFSELLDGISDFSPSGERNDVTLTQFINRVRTVVLLSLFIGKAVLRSWAIPHVLPTMDFGHPYISGASMWSIFTVATAHGGTLGGDAVVGGWRATPHATGGHRRVLFYVVGRLIFDVSAEYDCWSTFVLGDRPTFANIKYNVLAIVVKYKTSSVSLSFSSWAMSTLAMGNLFLNSGRSGSYPFGGLFLEITVVLPSSWPIAVTTAR